MKTETLQDLGSGHVPLTRELMPRGKRPRDEDADSGLSAEERSRRERQRELQRAAVAAKAAGEAYVNEDKKKRKPLAARRLEERKQRRKSEKAAARREVQKEVKRQKLAAPDVIIVPIFWKGEAKQMARVLSACADVEAALADAGKRVLLDAAHKYTPGQKFAHWEHKGVKLRIEVGPREAERGCCTLARTFTPGEPASRTHGVRIEAQTLPAELEKLAELEAPQIPDEEEEDELAANARAESVAVAVSSAKPQRGGDDLEDDFEDGAQAMAPAAEDAGDDTGGGAAAVAQSAKAPKQGSKAKGAGLSKPTSGTASASVRAKKARTVSF